MLFDIYYTQAYPTQTTAIKRCVLYVYCFCNEGLNKLWFKVGEFYFVFLYYASSSQKVAIHLFFLSSKFHSPVMLDPLYSVCQVSRRYRQYGNVFYYSDANYSVISYAIKDNNAQTCFILFYMIYSKNFTFTTHLNHFATFISIYI